MVCRHGRQVRVHTLRSLLIPSQAKCSVMSCCVACSPGCERECSAVNTVRRSDKCTNGRGAPVLVSLMMAANDAGRGREVRQRKVEEFWVFQLSSHQLLEVYCWWLHAVKGTYWVT